MESVFHTNLKKGLLSVLRVGPLLLLLLLLSTGTSAEEGAQEKNSHCHNYAGGHVYPGEAFRVPVSDHSLHLSKAKSEFFFLFAGLRLLVAQLRRADVRLSSCRQLLRPKAWCFFCSLRHRHNPNPLSASCDYFCIVSWLNPHVTVVNILKLLATWFCRTRHSLIFTGLGSFGSPPLSTVHGSAPVLFGRAK